MTESQIEMPFASERYQNSIPLEGANLQNLSDHIGSFSDVDQAELDDIGGESLNGSGFETEQSETEFSEARD